MRCAGVLLAAALACAPAGVHADEVAAGRALALRLCAGCHEIAPGEAAPRPDAPPFTDIVRRYPPETLSEALAEGAMVGHPDMPAFELPPDDVAALVGYLESLLASE